MTKEITVVLADDHPIVMRGFAAALREHGVLVIEQAQSGEEALSAYAEHRPDVMILDVRFGASTFGISVAKKILQSTPKANILFLSQFDQQALVNEAYLAGGRAFLTKSCSPEELIKAVQIAAEGKQYFMPKIAERYAKERFQDENNPLSKLDKHELEIFILMGKGLTNQQIAENISSSTRTTQLMTAAIREKLGISNQAEITRLVIRHGYLEP